MVTLRWFLGIRHTIIFGIGHAQPLAPAVDVHSAQNRKHMWHLMLMRMIRMPRDFTSEIKVRFTLTPKILLLREHLQPHGAPRGIAERISQNKHQENHKTRPNVNHTINLELLSKQLQ